jgi:hypothetical protein
MVRRVVDSNVAVVANGRDTNATPTCRLNAATALKTLLDSGQIIVDDAGEMMAEYQRHCNPKGQPGVGDRFFREILMNYEGKVQRITLTKNQNGEFVDFPNDPALAGFDPSDKKFAAAGRQTNSPILNATDSDWLIFRAALAANGIEVEFVCGTNRANWFVP